MKTITLFGSENCHKTIYYQNFFESRNLKFTFHDVLMNDNFAQELRNLYPNGNLHFPTILIDEKRLRNPKDKDLLKWLNK
ncbi:MULTISPECIES: glutaredoxin family protein [unclassified Bizionia]|uniref:glutaredoxin family protein n=1 Tax=unclassified Bizionia TaxID=2626393 RepID=UPI002048FE5B|nr:glutaredoxin [Bizionia sp. M204]UPS92188.1 glutaredoxin family protein [Bizionia sp. M204]